MKASSQALIKAFLFLSTVLLACAGLYSCSSNKPGNGQIPIRFGVANPFKNLDPRFTTEAGDARIVQLIYATLVKFDDAGKPIASLASWQQLSPVHYRFTLQPKRRKFHDGSVLTAQDVKATLSWIRQPQDTKKNASPHRNNLRDVKRITVLDSERFDIELTKPDPLFVGNLMLGILPKALIEKGHEFSKNPIGSGPFRFGRWKTKDHLVLRRVRDNQEFEFIYIGNATTRVLKLLNKEIDILQNNLPRQLIDYLAKQESIKIVRRKGINCTYLGFNLRHKALKKLKVRRAIAHAINRKEIVEKMFGPKARVANAIFGPEHWAGHPTLTLYDYDLNKAKQLLNEAGYNKDNPLRLVYNTSNDPFRVTLATIIQYQLMQAGIQVELQTYDFSTVFNNIKKGHAQLFSLSWVAVKSPDIFRMAYHSDSIPTRTNLNKGKNRFRYRDKVIDDLIEKAETSLDTAERVKYYRKIHERLAEKLPVVPLWFEEQMAAMQQSLSGYRLSNEGNFESLEFVQKTKVLTKGKPR